MAGRLDGLELVASEGFLDFEFEASGPGKGLMGVFGRDRIPDWVKRVEVSPTTFAKIAATFKLDPIEEVASA